jgi:hypothetical protein
MAASASEKERAPGTGSWELASPPLAGVCVVAVAGGVRWSVGANFGWASWVDSRRRLVGPTRVAEPSARQALGMARRARHRGRAPERSMNGWLPRLRRGARRGRRLPWAGKIEYGPNAIFKRQWRERCITLAGGGGGRWKLVRRCIRRGGGAVGLQARKASPTSEP